MTAARPSPLNEQRLQRLSLWLALTVAWFVAHVLGAVAPEAAARLLAQHARSARLLLVARAVKRLGFTAARIPLRIERRRLTCRAVAGAALRHAFRQRTLAGRARALCAALADAERWIARIVRRLRRGFTKLRCLPKPHRTYLPAAAPAAPLPKLHAVNTS
jgi:hypothetical protein